jgi:cytochrome c oxidase assembly protein subunit 15
VTSLPTDAPPGSAGSVPSGPADGRSGRVRHLVFGAGVLAQLGIVVTGGLVRLTASGLGCPTWPRCFEGSYVPVAGQPQSFHKLIEFGNRMLTFVLVLVLLACVAEAWRRVPRRRSLVLLSACGLLGVAAQAVIGGLSVLTDLNPYVVALHFLVSMPLIAAALAVYERDLDGGDAPAVPVVRREVRTLGFVLVGLASVVLVIGTLVTGSGPHSGDVNRPARTGFDPARIAWLHADVVVLFVGLVVALLLALHLTDAPALVQRRALVLLAVTLSQGLIGYVQFFTGVPWALVGLHVLGAVLLWVAVLRVPYAMRTRD